MSDNIDFDFAPASYWGPQDLPSFYGSHITGELRRRRVKEEADNWDGPVDYLQASLGNETRSMQAAIHPWCMGGEYLPPLRPNELEIARITLQSVTMDVFSIRARRSGSRIYYSLVDEYMDQNPPKRFVIKPRWGKRPLTMRQVISIIDGNGLIDDYRDLNFDGQNIEEVYNFACASSEFYPQLDAYYIAKNGEWRLRKLRELEEENDPE